MFYVLQHEWRVFQENLNKQNFAAFCCLVLVYLKKKKSVFLLVLLFIMCWPNGLVWAPTSGLGVVTALALRSMLSIRHISFFYIICLHSFFFLLLLLSVSCCMKQQWERVGTLTALSVWVYFIHAVSYLAAIFQTFLFLREVCKWTFVEVVKWVLSEVSVILGIADFIAVL